MRPAADVSSESCGGVGVVSGASVWLSEDTPPGAATAAAGIGSTSTCGDGTYVFDRLPPGDSTVAVEPPDGYGVDAADRRRRQLLPR